MNIALKKKEKKSYRDYSCGLNVWPLENQMIEFIQNLTYQLHYIVVMPKYLYPPHIVFICFVDVVAEIRVKCYLSQRL